MYAVNGSHGAYPSSAPQVDKEACEAPPEDHPATQAPALVVDDEELIRASLARLLWLLGCWVNVAESASDAAELCEHHVYDCPVLRFSTDVVPPEAPGSLSGMPPGVVSHRGVTRGRRPRFAPAGLNLIAQTVPRQLRSYSWSLSQLD